MPSDELDIDGWLARKRQPSNWLEEERSFRRGYLYSYDACIDDIGFLLDEGLTRRAAFDLVVTFFNDVLMEWFNAAHRDDVSPEPPLFRAWYAAIGTTPNEDE